MDLAQLQRSFTRYLLEGDAAIEPAIAQSEEVPRETRLRVYADAYQLRLVDALAANYPRLQQLLGDAGFAELAQAYLRTHPSSHPSVRWFGNHLPDFMRQQYPDPPALAELASWEWAIAHAFDAPDTPPLTEQDLSVVAPEEWASLRLQLHPAAQVLHLRTNAPALFKTLSGDSEPPRPSAADRTQAWLIWRLALAPHYRSTGEDEAALLGQLAAGMTFEQLCNALCNWHAEEDVPARAALLLKGWVREELLIRADKSRPDSVR